MYILCIFIYGKCFECMNNETNECLTEKYLESIRKECAKCV